MRVSYQPSMKAKTRVKLKDILGDISPKKLAHSHSLDIESLRSSISGILQKINEVNSILDKVSEIEEIKKIVDSTYELVKNLEKDHGIKINEIVKLAESNSKDIKYRLQDYKKQNDQVIEEMRGEMKISYSKMGGGTMPRLLQAETPGGSINASNTVFTLKNIPLFMEQDGQHISTANGGYTLAGYAGSVTITCSVAPTQSLNSYYQ